MYIVSMEWMMSLHPNGHLSHPNSIKATMFLKSNMSLIPIIQQMSRNLWFGPLWLHLNLNCQVTLTIPMIMKWIRWWWWWSITSFSRKWGSYLYMLVLGLSISLCNNMKIQIQMKEIQPNIYIYIYWFRLNGLLFGLEWICISHNFLASRNLSENGMSGKVSYTKYDI